MDLIPTSPEESLTLERVDPRTQGCQQLPILVREALKESWATPDQAKPGIVGALLEPFFAQDVVLDKDGNQIRLPPNRAMLIELAKMLRMLDQTQFERDHPEQAAKAKGGSTSIVSVQTNIQAASILRELIERKAISEESSDKQLNSTPLNDDRRSSDNSVPSLVESGPLGNGRLDGKVETGSSPEDHQ